MFDKQTVFSIHIINVVNLYGLSKFIRPKVKCTFNVTEAEENQVQMHKVKPKVTFSILKVCIYPDITHRQFIGNYTLHMRYHIRLKKHTEK